MAAYVIAEVDVQDPERYEDYKKLTPASIAAYGGRFVARGGRSALLEGEASPARLVLVEFDSFEQATAWYHSVEYAPAKALRQATAKSRLMLVEGL